MGEGQGGGESQETLAPPPGSTELTEVQPSPTEEGEESRLVEP